MAFKYFFHIGNSSGSGILGNLLIGWDMVYCILKGTSCPIVQHLPYGRILKIKKIINYPPGRVRAF